MYLKLTLTMVALLSMPACSQVDTVELEKQVAGIERAFAATMAKRDLEAFKAFIADEAIFIGPTPLQGKE